MSRPFEEWTDQDLQRMAACGDRAAEETLLLRYSRTVRACARPLFLAGGDSEDLTQEGFLGLLDAIREFQPDRDAAFATFAQVCVRNRLRSAVRAAARAKHAPLNSSLSLERDDVEPAGVSPASPEELLIAQEDRAEELRRLERDLSSLEREILRHYLNGLSYSEIAQATHRSAKSVDNAVQRIRKKLARP